MDNWFAQVMRCFSLESTLQKKEEELVLLADTITLKCGSEEGAKNSLQYFAKKEELIKKNIELVDSFLEKGRKIYPYKLLLLEKGGNEIDVAEGFRISEEIKKKNPKTMQLLGRDGDKK